MRIVLLLLLSIAVFPAYAQGVYKWTDAKGVVHYGDEAPAEGKYAEVALDPPTSAPAEKPNGQGAAAQSTRHAQPNALAQRRQPLDIVMYARSDCGYCAKARRFFGERGIAFVEKDVQRQPQAAAEWKRLGGVAVPLFVINGVVSSGFSAEGMTQRLTRYGR